MRAYHFGDWLYFKLDQARDAFIALQAYQKGPGYLPLLGDRAGGTTLLLGPAYYYFQYLAVTLTRNTHPATFALPDLFFGMLAVPMFYIFSRKYFSRNWSIYLASFLSLCFFAIQYSRFSWNTNPLPFFTLLYFFALLEFLEKKSKNPLAWGFLAGLALAFSSQFHFLAFLGLPLLTALLVAFDWKNSKNKINFKNIAVFAGGFLILYVSWILNDLETNWRNSHDFWNAILTKLLAATLWQDIVEGLQSFALNWIIILTGYVAKMKQTWLFVLMWLVFILPSLFLNWKLFRAEKDQNRKRFLLLTLLWFSVFFIVYIPIGSQLRARYFMATLALPIIFLGYVFEYFSRKGISEKIVYAVSMLLIISNLYGTLGWFSQMQSAQTEKKIDAEKTFIYKNEDGVVLWNIDRAAKFIADDCDGKRVLFAAPPVYIKSVDFMLLYYGINNRKKRESQTNEACYYAVGYSKNDLAGLSNKITNNIRVVSKNKFGILSVYKVEPINPANELIDFNNPADVKITQESQAVRLFWSSIGNYKKQDN